MKKADVDPRRALGAEGEAHAAAHLEARGYRLLGRNVRAGGVEIDLVAERGGILIFVEVKTRLSRWHGLPEESVDARKRSRLVRGAAAWLANARQRTNSVRFDVVCCERASDGSWVVRHLEGAFDAGD